ncbi:MAG: methyltransferase domain-containing protein [Nitrosopumilus sp.]|nr:methyltransferase domain-containing protein [Nitrosopumilus sp.]MDA7958648.1 methyltransferase domain-containing protein [Nitrosopumilus sp.]MDA7960369.1 methyltransferase domain-containing protein [Nitrosopumilus sp.]
MTRSQVSRPGSPGEYPPSEDTFLLADYIGGARGGAALDIGTGSGYLARLLEGRFGLVVATDIDAAVLADQTYPAGDRVCCDAASALRMSFDLVVCNMPYLATESVEDPATDGGPGGTEVPLRILRSARPRIAPGGRMAFTTTSLSDHGRLVAECAHLGMPARIASRRRLFFEELLLVEASLPAQ